jgi:hypothetical protein
MAAASWAAQSSAPARPGGRSAVHSEEGRMAANLAARCPAGQMAARSVADPTAAPRWARSEPVVAAQSRAREAGGSVPRAVQEPT